MNTKTNELRQMSVQELEIRADELRRELFKLRLNAATSPVKAYSSIKGKLKSDIARTMTLLQQKSSSN